MGRRVNHLSRGFPTAPPTSAQAERNEPNITGVGQGGEAGLTRKAAEGRRLAFQSQKNQQAKEPPAGYAPPDCLREAIEASSGAKPQILLPFCLKMGCLLSKLPAPPIFSSGVAD